MQLLISAIERIKFNQMLNLMPYLCKSIEIGSLFLQKYLKINK